MSRWIWAVCVVALLGTATAASALADKVTLTNGDVLQGEVVQKDGRLEIQHAILGKIDVALGDVAFFTRERDVPAPPAPAVATTARRVAAPCAAPAPCTSTPTPATCDPCAATAEEADEPKSPWDFAIGLSISNETGNTEKFGLGADLEVGREWGPHEYRWRVNGFYEEAQGTQTEGKYLSNMRYARRISPRGRVMGLWIVDRDDFADINLRSGLFAVYQHEFIRRKNTTFRGGIGAGWVVEDRVGVDVLNTPALLGELDFKHEFASGDSIQATYFVTPYIDHLERSLNRFEFRYAHPLRDHLDVTVGFLADYVPEPPSGVDPLDTKLTFGLRWKK